MQLSSTHQLDWILTKYCFCSSMPDLTAIMPGHQNFTNYSGGGVVEIVHQEVRNPKFQQRKRFNSQVAQAQHCSVIVSPHEGGGALRRAKSFSRPRSTSPNPAILRWFIIIFKSSQNICTHLPLSHTHTHL